MNAALQLSFESGGLDPHELAQLSITARALIYAELGLDRLQRQSAEEAVRAVIAKTYRKAVR